MTIWERESEEANLFETVSEREIGKMTILWAESKRLLPHSLTNVGDNAGGGGAVVAVRNQGTLQKWSDKKMVAWGRTNLKSSKNPDKPSP